MRVIRLVAALALLAVVSGCGVFVAPSPTARDIGDFVSSLVRRGATISDQVGGDAGCADPTLYGNSVRYNVRMPTDPSPAPVYVMRWKNQSTFDDSAAAFQACVSAFEQAHPGQTVTVFEESPWRVFGPAWSVELHDTVELAVHESAGASGADAPE